MSEFSIGKYLRKKSGAFWEGTVVGHYSTDQTPDGVAVQLFGWENGPVQIYPAAALELCDRRPSRVPPPPSSHVAPEPIVCDVLTMQHSSGFPDHFTRVRVGQRELTLFMSKIRGRCEYHAAELNWLLNGAEKPHILDFSDDEPEGLSDYLKSIAAGPPSPQPNVEACLAQIEARIAELEDALRPFAKEADEYTGWVGSVMVEADEEGGVREAWYTIAHTRKARDLLKSTSTFDIRNRIIEGCALLVEKHAIQDTSNGKRLVLRQEGNLDGLFYAEGIRDMKTEPSPSPQPRAEGTP